MNDITTCEERGIDAAVWRYAMASRAHVVIDADDYFELMRDTMCNARQRIFMIGWDFDTRILLTHGRRWWNLPRKTRYPARLGAFIVWLVERTDGLEIRLLKWNVSLIKSLFRGSMVLDLVRWAMHKSIEFKFDSAHPVGCSHHQKIVVVDDKVAACGGIDMTSDRWDTREHVHDDPRRKRPTGRHYDPWHDATMMLEGDVAGALAELGRDRWQVAGGGEMAPCRAQAETPWPESLKAEFRDVEIGIARTRAKYDQCDQVSEIEELFVRHIRRAKRFIYAETQYFASRRIAEVIGERLTEADPPEIVIVMPITADGWLEQVAMDTARHELVHAVGELDHKSRFRIFVPHTDGGTPIYVHAKVLIVDDEVLRVGSANMNNRSMGLDSECDVFIDVDRPANAHVGPTIEGLRHSLLAEHCGMSIEEVASALDEHGSMLAMIAARPATGKRLEPLRLQPLSEAGKVVADSGVLDPERPELMFEPIGRHGLGRKRLPLRDRIKARVQRRRLRRKRTA